MKMTKRGIATGLTVCVAVAAWVAPAADIYVSLASGKNKNAGTKEAPLKNLWKALEKAEAGDVIHVAEGNYPGKMKCGWVQMEKPCSIVGGYSNDFAQRDPLKFKTMLQPTNDQNDKKGSAMALFLVNFNNKPFSGFKIVVDGLIFDDGFASSYHAVKGKPEGLETGMWLAGPAKGAHDKFPSADRCSIYSVTSGRAEGDITIRNCAFVNGSNMGVNLSWYKGHVLMVNNIFCNNRMIAAQVSCSAATPSVTWEFARNTVVYTWSRQDDLADMGYALRVNAGVEANIHDNIIGLNVMSGFDGAMGDPKKKKIRLDNNVFFLNRESDVQVTVSPSIAKVRVEDFEDLEGYGGIESIEGNTSLDDPAAFVGHLNARYLEAFLAIKVTPSLKFDEEESEALGEAFGLEELSMSSDMYANRYPLDDALKLFGVMNGKGAQKDLSR